MATITVEADGETSFTDTFRVFVTPLAPQVTLSTPNASVNEGDTAELNIDVNDPTGVFNSDGESWTFSISWGDGTSVEEIEDPLLPLTHRYLNDGSFAATVTVIDDDGDQAQFTQVFNVGNVAPTLDAADVIIPETADEGTPTPFLATAFDPGDDDLTYTWDFDDGNFTTGSNVVHAFAEPGEYNVRVTVDDGDGETVIQTKTITVNNVSPSVIPPLDMDTTEGWLGLAAGTFTIRDPGGIAETVTYEIDWGDGSPLVTGSTTLTVDGDEATGGVYAEHVYADDGIYVARITVTDADGGSSDDEIASGDLDGNAFTVTVSNVSPALDTISLPNQIEEGVQPAIPYRLTFSDPSFGTAYSDAETYEYRIDWGDDSPIDFGTATVEVNGSTGSPTLGSLEAFHTYGDDGTYDVVVTLLDGTELTTSSFEVTVGNLAPILNDLSYPTQLEAGTPLKITGDTSDVAADSVFVEVDIGDGVVRRAARDGDAFEFSHVIEAPGSYTITVVARDEDGGESTIETFDLTVTPGPNIELIGAATHAESSTTPYELTLSNLDQAGRSFVSATLNWGDGTSQEFTPAQLLTLQTGGSLTLLHLFEDDGPVDGLANIFIAGVDSDDGISVLAELRLPITNVVPSATIDPIAPVDEGSTTTLTLSGINDPSASDLANIRFSYDFNNDGDFTDLGELYQVADSSVEIPAIWLSDDAPDPVVRVRIEDDDGGYVDLTQTIVVHENPPTIDAGGDSVAFVDAQFQRYLTLDDSDLDGPWTIRVDWNGDGDFLDAEDQEFSTTSRDFMIERRFESDEAGLSMAVTVQVEDALGAQGTDAFLADVKTLDVTAPTSSVDPLPALADSLLIPISVTGSDLDAAASAFVSGVEKYEVFVSEDAGAFESLIVLPAQNPNFVFEAESGHTYFFRSVAVDRSGNSESKSGVDSQIIVNDFDAPQTQVVSAIPTTTGLFEISVSGLDSGGAGLLFFDVYVSIDSGVSQLVGTAGAGVPDSNGGHTASLSYQGLTDGIERSYRFFSVGRDSASNIEAAPKKSEDVIRLESFADNGLQPTGIDVQLGASQRSYIQNLDVLFNRETGLDDLLASNAIEVERFGLDAPDVTPGTGVPIAGFAINRIDDRLRLDFGPSGITGNVYDTSADGMYRVLIDVDRNGSFLDNVDGLFEFHRILGDANGDAIMNAADVNLINSQQGQSGSNLDGDVDGNGNVDATDAAIASFQANAGIELAPALRGLLDD